MRSLSLRRFVAALTVGACAAGAFAGLDAAPAGAATYPVAGSLTEGIALALLHPDQAPPGANVPGCRPSAAHPTPVVLVNGTFANQYDNWAGLAPTLANNGYCVFTFDYGKSFLPFVYQLGPMDQSVNQVSAFVDHVLATTGAGQVDLVGHSQGGLMAEYYTKRFGRSKVDDLVALSPTTHGTTLVGLATLAKLFGITNLVDLACQSCIDQTPGSDVVRYVEQGGVTVPGVSYTVIETWYEFVVTPAPEAAFIREPGVKNLIVQNSNLFDLSDHAGLAYSTTAWRLTMKALDA